MPRNVPNINDDTAQREAIRESYSKAIDLKRKREVNRSYKEHQEIALRTSRHKAQRSSLIMHIEKQQIEPEDTSNSSEEDEDAETEDEDGDDLTPAADVALLKTLARIQKKDPSIYDNSKPIFDGNLFL